MTGLIHNDETKVFRFCVSFYSGKRIDRAEETGNRATVMGSFQKRNWTAFISYFFSFQSRSRCWSIVPLFRIWNFRFVYLFLFMQVSRRICVLYLRFFSHLDCVSFGTLVFAIQVQQALVKENNTAIKLRFSSNHVIHLFFVLRGSSPWFTSNQYPETI